VKKNTVLLVSGVVVFFVVLGVFLVSKRSKSQSMMGDSMESESMSNQSENFVGSLADAIRLGKAMKCTWKDEIENNTGTAFVEQDKVYYEYRMAGKEGYMISKDDCVWTWNKDETEGMKICAEPDAMEETQDSDYEIPEAGQVDTGGYEFKCEPAAIHEFTFTPPANVNFVNPMEMMPSNLNISY